MKPFRFCIIFAGILCSAMSKLNQDTIDKNVALSKVERKLDISSHLVKSRSTIVVENKGTAPIRSFLYLVEPSLKNGLSFISASKKDSSDKPLGVTATVVSGHERRVFYRISLLSPLEGGKQVTIEVEATFAHVLRPFPSQIAQAEKQLVVLDTNLFFPSPYPVGSQTTVVTTNNVNVESYTKTKPVSQSDNTITYGPYENKAAFSEAPLKVHEENNSPFITVTNLNRIIEVSHWGNIAVEEYVDLKHSGAQLKGSFSRFDYQRQQDGFASVKSFKTSLPASSRDIYYRDEIGNISTSNMREMDDSVEVELRPRFPLFGGWKTRYFLGYNVPSYEYLFYKGDNYALKMRFVDHIFDDMVIDDMQLKVILPEGAKDIELKVPFEVERAGDEVHYTYLDTLGRPVVVIKKTKLVEQHIQDFELHYTFKKINLLQEPLLVVGAFYLLFLTVIIYVRLDFAITKDEAKESRLRVSNLVDEVQNAHDRRSALYQSYDDAINKFKASKDSTAFVAGRKKIDADYKTLTNQIQGLQSQLKLEGSDAAEKVSELQRLDSQYKDQVGNAITAAEKLVSGKLGRNQYLDTEAALTAKCEDIIKKMESLRSTI